MPIILAALAFGMFFGSQIDDKLDKNEPPPQNRPSVTSLAITVTVVSVAVIAAAVAYKKVRGGK